MSDLEKYNEVKEWLGLLRTPSTRKFYLTALTTFCRYVNVTPSKLVTLKTEKAKKLVIKYLIHLKDIAKQTSGKPVEGQMSVNSIPYYMSGIKSFLEHNEIELKWKAIRKYYPETKNNTFRSYTIEELRRLLALADRREKVILLLMASSGIRVGAIPDLKFKHLQEIEGGLGKLHIYADSRNDCYWTICSPECVAAIADYRRYRVEQLNEEITDESSIVRDAYKIRPILVGTVRKTIWELFKKTDLNGDELQPDHACRKFFNTVCINAGMNHTIKECLLGHSVKLDDVYYDLTNERTLKQVIAEYEKALPELTITEEARTALSNEIKLKNLPQIEAMQAKIKDLEQKDKAMSKVWVEMFSGDEDRLPPKMREFVRVFKRNVSVY